MEWLNHVGRAVTENLRWADLFDIFLVAIFIYFVLRWLSAQTSRGALVGVLVVGLCYLLSDWLDLYLTRLLFQAGFIFLLLSIVVVLQQDIRRGFEKLAALKLKREKKPTDPNLEVVGELLSTVAQMSAEKTGALLIFPGQEPVERFTHGGIRVDACVSPTLLQSIFNPRSPGHDGAVILRNDRVEKLGVHLPLSTNLKAVGSGGTRHAAALGLSERCDALAVVVSEERGTISVAQHGLLRRLSAEQLEPILLQYQSTPAIHPLHSLTRRTLARRLPLKFASLGIGIILWAIFAFRVDVVQRDYVVPIEFRNVPNNLVVATPSANYARLVVSGTERVLAEIDSSALVVTFDLSDAKQGQTFRLQTRDGIEHLPASLDVMDVEPAHITLEIEASEAMAAP